MSGKEVMNIVIYPRESHFTSATYYLGLYSRSGIYIKVGYSFKVNKFGGNKLLAGLIEKEAPQKIN
jgi:hypothetical protein